jgi:hypothetical protein
MVTVKVIYTKHAQERIERRSLNRTSIETTIANPDKRWRQESNEYKFIKQQGTRRYHVVARFLPAQRAWLVISAWVRGEEDRSILWDVLVAPFKWLLRLIKRF